MHKKSRPIKAPSPPPSSDEDLTQSAPPTSINPYTVLSLPNGPSSTPSEITKAYRLSALRSHPDKAPSPDQKEAYTKKFQEVAFAYAILSDERRKKRYDTTGNTSESLDLDDDEFDWTTYFREKYNEVLSTDAIEKFRETYQGSEEETADVLNAYVEYKGDMDKIFETVMCSSILDDEGRFREMIDEAIESGEVKPFKKYTSEKKATRDGRKKKASAEAKEAEEYAEELGLKDKLFGKTKMTNGKKGGAKGVKDGGEDALKSLIQQRQKGRAEGFFERLEEKYSAGTTTNGKGGKGKKRQVIEEPEDGPSEEAFREMGERAKRKK